MALTRRVYFQFCYSKLIFLISQCIYVYTRFSVFYFSSLIISLTVKLQTDVFVNVIQRMELAWKIISFIIIVVVVVVIVINYQILLNTINSKFSTNKHSLNNPYEKRNVHR